MADDAAARARYTEHIGDPYYYQIVCKPDQDLKGKVLIINNSFKETEDERIGSEIDVKNLEQLFEKVGLCEVTIKQDVITNDFIRVLKNFVDEGPRACFYAVFIMSHGTGKQVGDESFDMIKGNDGGLVNVLDLMKILTDKNRKHLLEAPVMMFVQACRGSEADGKPKNYAPEEVALRFYGGENLTDNADGEASIRKTYRGIRDSLIGLLPNARLIDSPEDEGDDVPDAGPNRQCLGAYSENPGQNEPVLVPNEALVICDEDPVGLRREESCPDEADYSEPNYVKEAPNMLVSFATLEGYLSFRNKHGSWFIQDLCSVFKASFHNQDVVSMIASVHNKISQRRSQNTKKPELHGCAVCSRTAHTFGEKKLCLFPGHPSPI